VGTFSEIGQLEAAAKENIVIMVNFAINGEVRLD